jgi:hypothetical protein
MVVVGEIVKKVIRMFLFQRGADDRMETAGDIGASDFDIYHHVHGVAVTRYCLLLEAG